MSKVDSYIFSGTSGRGRQLIDEVIASGYKISPNRVLGIVKDPFGRIIWLEKGDESSGLKHIISQHGKQLNDKGISNDEIPDYILEAVRQGNVVGIQGKVNLRTIYEFMYRGVVQRLAIQVSDNGYIVGANPKHRKKG